MTEKIFEVSTRFDGHEIEELQQYTEEELFEWGKDFADADGRLSENLEEETLETLNEEEVRIVEYCGNNTFTEGWEQIYSIQPMQALGNSDFAEDEVDDFVEVVETELSENEALDLDGDIVREFGDRLRSMLEGQNAIGVLTIERKY